MSVPEKFKAVVSDMGTEKLAYLVLADKTHTKAYEKAYSSALSWAKYRIQYNNTEKLNKIVEIDFENTPKTGFYVVTAVTRQMTSNKLFRIHHPSGFEFEISAENMWDIMDTCTISKGVILDPMYLSHKKELINENTNTFKRFDEEKNIKEFNKEFGKTLKFNDLFKVEDNVYQYLGRYYIRERSTYNETISRRHVVYSIEDDRVIFFNSFEVYFSNYKIEEYTNDENIPFSDTIENTIYKVCNNKKYNGSIIIMDVKKFTLDDILVDEVRDTTIITVDDLGYDNMFYKIYYNDKLYDKYSNSYNRDVLVCSPSNNPNKKRTQKFYYQYNNTSDEYKNEDLKLLRIMKLVYTINRGK